MLKAPSGVLFALAPYNDHVQSLDAAYGLLSTASGRAGSQNQNEIDILLATHDKISGPIRSFEAAVAAYLE